MFFFLRHVRTKLWQTGMKAHHEGTGHAQYALVSSVQCWMSLTRRTRCLWKHELSNGWQGWQRMVAFIVVPIFFCVRWRQDFSLRRTRYSWFLALVSVGAPFEEPLQKLDRLNRVSRIFIKLTLGVFWSELFHRLRLAVQLRFAVNNSHSDQDHCARAIASSNVLRQVSRRTVTPCIWGCADTVSVDDGNCVVTILWTVPTPSLWDRQSLRSRQKLSQIQIWLKSSMQISLDTTGLESRHKTLGKRDCESTCRTRLRKSECSDFFIQMQLGETDTLHLKQEFVESLFLNCDAEWITWLESIMRDKQTWKILIPSWLTVLASYCKNTDHKQLATSVVTS